MKAAVFRAFGHPLAVETVDDPTPGAGEVIVRVGRCGICGSDLHATGEPSHLAPPGSVLGHELAGEIVGIGRGVESVRQGEIVAVYPLSSCGRCASCLAGEPAWCADRKIDGGGYAEYVLTHERQCFKLPQTLSLADGALVEPMAVGLHTVNVAGMQPGDDIVVIGTGPIGLATIYWARRFGAGRIAATARTTRRAEMAERLGATMFLAPSDDPARAAEDALGGAPDIVFECVGAPGLLGQSIAMVKRRGTVVLNGLCWGTDTLTPAVAVAKEVRIQPAAFHSFQEFQYSIAPLDEGAVEPRAMITDTVSLDALPEAFEALRDRTHQCKVMIDPAA